MAEDNHVNTFELQEETDKDPVLQKLIDTVQKGWPTLRIHFDADIRQYWDSRDEIAEIGGILFKGDRVIVPKIMRLHILNTIHESHLGMVKCKQLARDVVYWPKMNSQIEEIASRCSECQERRNRQPKQTLKPMEIHNRPWQTVAADLLQCDGSSSS